MCNLAPRKLGTFERFIIGLGEGLRTAGDDLVCVFSAEPCTAVSAELRRQDVRWHVVSRWGGGAAEKVRPWVVVRPMLRVLRCERPDVVAVHFGNELPSAALILLARLFVSKPVKWIWHQRQQIADPGVSGRHVSRIRLASWVFDHMVAIYKGGMESLVRRGVKPDKISVIYNALDEPEPGGIPYVRREFAIPDEAVVAVNIGWLVPRKRIHLAIRAFAAVCQRSEVSCYLLVVGDGPEAEALHRLAAELNVAARVRFTGFRGDICAMLAESDVLVHSAQAEACVNVVQEAMAVGCPVVMMDAGAAREQVEEGVTGFVVGRDNLEDLQDRLCEMVGNRELRIRMGEAAKQRWDAFFKLSLSVDKHCALYRSLVSETVERQHPED